MYTDDQKRQYESTSFKCYNHFCVEVPCQKMIIRNSVNYRQNYNNRNLTAKGFSCSKDNSKMFNGFFLKSHFSALITKSGTKYYQCYYNKAPYLNNDGKKFVF